MAVKISADQLGAEIAKILNEYEGEVVKSIPEITEKVAKKGVVALKNASKSSFNGNEYWKGWKATSEPVIGGAKVTLHNAKLPGLPHLLEHGHAKVGGGRVNGRAHIAPVEQNLVKEYERSIINELKRNN